MIPHGQFGMGLEVVSCQFFAETDIGQALGLILQIVQKGEQQGIAHGFINRAVKLAVEVGHAQKKFLVPGLAELFIDMLEFFQLNFLNIFNLTECQIKKLRKISPLDLIYGLLMPRNWDPVRFTI